MLRVNGKRHEFTRLPLDLPSRGLPMAKPRRRTKVQLCYQLQTWREAPRVYRAIMSLRRAGHMVYRISDEWHLINNVPADTETLLARASKIQEGHHGQSSEKIRHQEESQDQVRS